MRIALLYNHDFVHLPPTVERRSQDSVVDVVHVFEKELQARDASVKVIGVSGPSFDFQEPLERFRPDVVVNLCESFGGDSRGEMLVAGALDLMGVPYTGSGPLALALSLHKDHAKLLLRASGIETPRFAVVRRLEQLRGLEVPLPAIVKPAREDASIGIDRHSVVHDRRELRAVCERVLTRHRQPALVEQYIEGRELNVGLLGDPPEALPIAEIDFTRLDRDHPRIVTYAAKWDESAPEFHATPSVPCLLPAALTRRVRRAAQAAFEALDCRDYGRVDMRLTAEGVPYVIEVNPNCDLSPEAGFARAALRGGLSYGDVVWRLVELARARGRRGRSPVPGARRRRTLKTPSQR